MIVALAAVRSRRPLEEAAWVEALRAFARDCRRAALVLRRGELDLRGRAQVHDSGAASATGWALRDESLWRWDGADLEIVAAGLATP